MNLVSASNPFFSNEAQTTIDFLVVFEQYPNEVMPFTASPDDVEPHGREIYARAVAGEFGVVAPYVAPVSANQPLVQGAQTL